MGDQSHRSDLRFDLHDLGLLDGGRDRAAEIIVRHAALVVHVPCCAFFVADHKRGLQLVRARYSQSEVCDFPADLPLAESFTSEIVDTDRVINHPDVGSNEVAANMVEARLMPMMSYLGVPVHGPAGEPIGAVAAIGKMPQQWGPMDISVLRDAAQLLSQTVLLKAALTTFKLMSRERKVVARADRWRN